MNTTTDRTNTHATFTLEREYDAPLDQVWAAFADLELKKRWFGGGDFHDVEFAEDFRVGGTFTNKATDGDGHRSEFRATYSDIVDRERIVYSYDMWLDGAHASTSITTITFVPDGSGTLLTFTEQGVHLDGVHGPGPEAAAGREHGTGWLLDALGAWLTTSA
jgi:uncharacterized protein YndB with AHSA1/START domain